MFEECDECGYEFHEDELTDYSGIYVCRRCLRDLQDEDEDDSWIDDDTDSWEEDDDE